MVGLTFSGKRFTIAFVLLLALGAGLGVLIAMRFQETLKTLTSLRSTWPRAAAVLEERYRLADPLFKDQPKDIRESWIQQRARFQSTNQYDVQAVAVPPLQVLYAEVESSLLESQPSLRGEMLPDLQAFAEVDAKMESLQSDWLGRICQVIFRLEIPARLYDDLRSP